MIYKEIPDIRSPYFTLRPYGFYAGIKGLPQVAERSALNNCTAAAWGLFAMNEKNPQCKIGCGDRLIPQPYDAGKWYNLEKTYKKSSEPVEGAIICFTNHVAYVNEVKDNGDIVIIESGYGAQNEAGLWRKTLKKEENYFRGKIYGEFMGFIWPAKCDGITTEQAINKMAHDVIDGKYGNAPQRKENIYNAIQAEVNKLCRKS